MDYMQLIIPLIIITLLALPLGKYIYNIITGGKSFVDPAMNRVDGLVYRLLHIHKDKSMTWKQYMGAILLTNAVLFIFIFAALCLQNLLPLNPNGVGALSPDLAFNTASSFITNTNLQHYSGEWGASHLTQMMLTALMFAAPATGLAATAAFLRGLTRQGEGLGNFYVDFTRFVTRLLLPLSIILAIVYIAMGVPQTLAGAQAVTTVEGKTQLIPLGPVAALEAIKNLASNGGGFWGANSAHPFENPSPLSDVFTIVSLGMIATSLVFVFGRLAKNKKQGWILYASMMFMLIASVFVVYIAETAGNPALANAGLNQSMGNMEGKEARFGMGENSVFTAGTTAYEVGAVNNMHDSLTPMAGFMAIWNMMMQTIFGGKGTGLIYIVMYAILAVFLSGLMVGRTPEYLGKKIEGREIRLIAFTILLHPLIILIPSAIALVLPQTAASLSNPGYHGISQAVYEMTSAAANNGSGFEGLGDNTVFWNLVTGVLMLVGRYVPIATMLAMSGSLSEKKITPAGLGTFRTDKLLFGVVLIFIMIIVNALTFFPTLVLGPISEGLTI